MNPTEYFNAMRSENNILTEDEVDVCIDSFNKIMRTLNTAKLSPKAKWCLEEYLSDHIYQNEPENLDA